MHFAPGVGRHFEPLFEFATPKDLRKIVEFYFFNGEINPENYLEDREKVSHIYY